LGRYLFQDLAQGIYTISLKGGAGGSTKTVSLGAAPSAAINIDLQMVRTAPPLARSGRNPSTRERGRGDRDQIPANDQRIARICPPEQRGPPGAMTVVAYEGGSDFGGSHAKPGRLEEGYG